MLDRWQQRMNKYLYRIAVLLVGLGLFAGCDVIEDILMDSAESTETELGEVTAIDALSDTEHFRPGALEHILEGELNHKGQAVGFHYDRLPTKKGEIIDGTKTKENEYGVYEAEVVVEGVQKTSNRGRSTFFPDTWDTQDIVDAINEAYDIRTFISGNTYEGLTEEGLLIQMYLDGQDRIISAFPVY